MGAGCRGRWPKDKTYPTLQYIPNEQPLFLGLLTRQTINGRGAGRRRTRGRAAGRWRTGGRRTNSVPGGRRNGTLANNHRAWGRSHHFPWVASNRGARTAISRRGRSRASGRFRRPVCHRRKFARTGRRHVRGDAQWQDRDSSNR